MRELDKKEIYEQINSIAEKNGVVFLGSDYFAELPLNELKDIFGVDCDVHNRSISGLKINEVEKILDDCVIKLYPQKIFLNIGESDIKGEEFDVNNFISQYEWLLYEIHNKIKTKIYILSIIDESEIASNVNKRLLDLASDVGCVYIDLVPAVICDKPIIGVFDLLRFHLRKKKISFAEAMNY